MRTLHTVAQEIRADWKNPYFGAVPYINAMSHLNSIDSRFGAEEGYDIVIYFLSNATTWRGEAARRIKAELKKMAGLK